MTTLSNLDELVLNIRNSKSRVYIKEAIKSYQAGAYRAAIISTWISVVYDIISKIRELKNAGDAQASQFLSDLDNHLKNENKKQLMVIESEILDTAFKKYEFLSLHEFQDLQRLKEDRHMCAHPAFISDNELFQPFPEIVRAHIVHSIEHLLRHPPVQGKALLVAFEIDLTSPIFPSSLDSLRIFLKSKYFERSKEVLIRNMIVVLIKKIINKKDISLDIATRCADCLQIVMEEEPSIYSNIMRDKFSLLISSQPKENLSRVFYFLSFDPSCWDLISSDKKEEIKALVQHITSKVSTATTSDSYISSRMFNSFKNPDLENHLLSLFMAFNDSIDEQIKIIVEYPYLQFCDRAIEIFNTADRFMTAEKYVKQLVRPIFKEFNADQIISLLGTISSNDQIYRISEIVNLVEDVFDYHLSCLSDTVVAWGGAVVRIGTSTYLTKLICQKLKDQGVRDLDLQSLFKEYKIKQEDDVYMLLKAHKIIS